MSDLYGSYADLAANEPEGVHYRILAIDRASAVAIVAPHGGRIEPGTSQVAALIAGDEFSLYCFESLVSGRRLHITSARFDEPKGLALVEGAEIAICIHGRTDGDDPRSIWLGGLHENLRDAIGASLERVGFRTSTDHHMKGKAPGNICNRGRMRAGVQLELPRSLRNEFFNDEGARNAFSSAVRDTIVRETGHRL
ncbi:MAG: poly-gamma-glutamate hydrolase family protein [Methylocystis sp.]